jgi:hypothetical protein
MEPGGSCWADVLTGVRHLEHDAPFYLQIISWDENELIIVLQVIIIIS